jgi:hypothetical protein
VQSIPILPLDAAACSWLCLTPSYHSVTFMFHWPVPICRRPKTPGEGDCAAGCAFRIGQEDDCWHRMDNARKWPQTLDVTTPEAGHDSRRLPLPSSCVRCIEGQVNRRFKNNPSSCHYGNWTPRFSVPVICRHAPALSS